VVHVAVSDESEGVSNGDHSSSTGEADDLIGSCQSVGVGETRGNHIIHSSDFRLGIVHGIDLHPNCV